MQILTTFTKHTEEYQNRNWGQLVHNNEQSYDQKRLNCLWENQNSCILSKQVPQKLLSLKTLYSDGSRISREEAPTPKVPTFEKIVCQNERIWTLRGHALGEPLDPPVLYYISLFCILVCTCYQAMLWCFYCMV